MLWVFAATVSMGLSLGFCLPPPALIAASGVTAVISLSVAPFTELEPATAVGMTFALVGVLQVGYLSGSWSRIRLSRPGHSSLVGDKPGIHLPGAGNIGIQHAYKPRPATASAHANGPVTRIVVRHSARPEPPPEKEKQMRRTVIVAAATALITAIISIWTTTIIVAHTQTRRDAAALLSSSVELTQMISDANKLADEKADPVD
jgi:hypothetical protein